MWGKKMRKKILPGDITKEKLLERIIRVDHAGEFGATRIYAGQHAILKNDECADTIKHMAEQEEEHLAYFSKEMIERKVRPTAMLPIWHVAGFALGAGTALMSKEAAMACTVAVEEAIDEHYQEQLAKLKDNDDESELKKNIEKFRQEELEHRAIGLENNAEQAMGYSVLSALIKKGSKTAIWLSQRV